LCWGAPGASTGNGRGNRSIRDRIRDLSPWTSDQRPALAQRRVLLGAMRRRGGVAEGARLDRVGRKPRKAGATFEDQPGETRRASNSLPRAMGSRRQQSARVSLACRRLVPKRASLSQSSRGRQLFTGPFRPWQACVLGVGAACESLADHWPRSSGHLGIKAGRRCPTYWGGAGARNQSFYPTQSRGQRFLSATAAVSSPSRSPSAA
jgi:hypothetical protein